MPQLHFLQLSEKPEKNTPQSTAGGGENKLLKDLFTSEQHKTLQAYQFNHADRILPEPMYAGGGGGGGVG